MLRVKMLHKNKAQAGVGRKILEQKRECFQAAGGGTDADDGKCPER